MVDLEFVSITPAGTPGNESYLVGVNARISAATRLQLRMEVVVAAGRPTRVRTCYGVLTARQAEASGTSGSRTWTDPGFASRELRMLTPAEERVVDRLETLTVADFAPKAEPEVAAAAE